MAEHLLQRKIGMADPQACACDYSSGGGHQRTAESGAAVHRARGPVEGGAAHRLVGTAADHRRIYRRPVPSDWAGKLFGYHPTASRDRCADVNNPAHDPQNLRDILSQHPRPEGTPSQGTSPGSCERKQRCRRACLENSDLAIDQRGWICDLPADAEEPEWIAHSGGCPDQRCGFLCHPLHQRVGSETQG